MLAGCDSCIERKWNCETSQVVFLETNQQETEIRNKILEMAYNYIHKINGDMSSLCFKEIVYVYDSQYYDKPHWSVVWCVKDYFQDNEVFVILNNDVEVILYGARDAK